MIVGDVNAGKVDSKAVQDSGNEAKGNAIATRFFALVKAQGNDLGRYLKEIYELNQAGRTEFRKVLEAHRKAMRASVRDVAESPLADVAKRAGASAFVRISEALSFSKACDGGFVPDFDMGYHWNIAHGRALLESKVAMIDGVAVEQVGPTVRRGRPPTSKVQKAVAYLDKLNLSDKERAALVKALSA